MPDFDTSVPHSARVYNYWLGGKDNYAADREAAERALAAYPNMVFAVRANRAFLARAVSYLAAQAGIRQFLDIGTGIPAASNTHEVAQQAAADCRIVYVDNDPVVLAHARALLASTPQGRCDYLDADLRDPGAIVAAAAQTLDFAQPVAVLLLSVLHLVPADDQVARIVARLMAQCPAGSFLVISHPASDIDAEQTAEATRRLNQAQVAPAKTRDQGAVTGLFAGLDLEPPGVVRVSRWRPRSELEAASPGALWAGVARKP
jgi:O-methyltransferase involved in polyketide biosynthesis